MKKLLATLCYLSLLTPFLVSDWYSTAEKQPDYFIVTLTNTTTGESTTIESEAAKGADGQVRLKMDVEKLVRGSYKATAVAADRLWNERSAESSPFGFSRLQPREPLVFSLER